MEKITEQDFLKSPNWSGIYFSFGKVSDASCYLDELELFLLNIKPHIPNEQYMRIKDSNKDMYYLSPNSTYNCGSDDFENNERIYAQINDSIEMIVSSDFGNPKISNLTNGPFQSLQDLLNAVFKLDEEMLSQAVDYLYGDLFSDSDSKELKQGADGSKTKMPFSNNEKYGRYSGSYAQEEEQLSDDYIDDVFGGDPEAYWNID